MRVIAFVGLSFASVITTHAETGLTLDRLYSYPSLIGTAPSGSAWTADGDKVAFLWNDQGYELRDVWIADASTAVVTRATLVDSTGDERDPGVVEVTWHPDSERFLFERADNLYMSNPASPEGGSLLGAGRRGRFSPDGETLAYLVDGDLWARPTNGESAPVRLHGTAAAEVYVRDFEWAPDSEHIAFVEEDERRVRLRGIPDYLSLETEMSPLRRAYPGEEFLTARLGIARLSGEVHFPKLGNSSSDPIHRYRWSSRGDLLVEISDVYVETRRVIGVGRDGSPTELYREEEPENVNAFWQIEWSPDGESIYILSDRDEDYHIYRIQDGALSRITSGDFAVQSFAVRANAIFFVANAPRPEERHLFRVGLDGGDPVQLSVERGTHDPTVSPDGRWAAVEFSSDGMPGELFLTSLDSEGQANERRVTSSPLPEFYEHDWADTTYVTFESHVDGATLYGRLQLPPDLDRSRRHPVIMGSVYTSTVRNQWGGRNVHPTWGLDQFLVERGYLVFNLDVRGSWGHGREFRRRIREDYGGIDVEDLESGARYLETLPFVDAERIGIWGSSYGGLLTCMSLFKKPGLFRAGVAAAPATNLFHALPSEMRVMMAPQDRPEAYEAASAHTHASGLRDPLMILHGMKDEIVLYKDSVVLVDRLMQLGRNVDFVTLPGAGHSWDMEAPYQTRFAFRKLVEFFDRHLRGGGR